jgi:pilus assembly protein CpaE
MLLEEKRKQEEGGKRFGSLSCDEPFRTRAGMNSMIRVVLVDPNEVTRQSLQRLLGGISRVWLAEICSSYAAALQSVTDNPPDLTLVALDSDPEQAVSLIQSIISTNPNAVVLPASQASESGLILRVIRAGAREFLALPAEVDELLCAIERLVHINLNTGCSARLGSRVIAVAGVSGGVGCTTLAVNLATTLAKNPDQTVVLADFDLLLGAVDTCLDIIPDQTLLEVSQSVDRLDLTLLKRTLSRHSSGLYVLPHPAAMEDVAKIEPDALRRVVGLLKAGFNTVVIDTSKSLQASDFVAFEMADTILLVVELEVSSLRNSGRFLQLIRQYDGLADKVRIVLNRTGSSAWSISLKKAEETLKMPISWKIPNAFKIINLARSKGVSVETEAPGSQPDCAFCEIAQAFKQHSENGAATAKPRRSRLAHFFL